MKTQSKAWKKFAVAGLAIAGAVTFSVGSSASACGVAAFLGEGQQVALSADSSAFAKEPQELQLKGQPVSKLVEALGEPKEKAPLPDGGQLYIYTYEHVLKGGHYMKYQPRQQPRIRVMSEDMTLQCRAEFDVSKDGVIRNSEISGKGCPTK